ncbi:hypothetical protein ACE38W_03940 [Chitinophaga sp. Hz27]|uniref:hypothetical protein n=1 Tax=Chitinophaga sp. Hz27 TaxID=3347169 RepID=UPI0035E04388
MRNVITSLGLCLILMPTKPAISLTHPKLSDSIDIPGFDKEIWQLDSLGCLDRRADFSEILLANKECILGKKRDLIELLLGVPNRWSFSKKYAFYYLTSGIQCRGNYDRSRDTVEVFTLSLRYSGDTLRDIGIFIP